jgi:AraC-like DNA-binding protein
MAFRKRLRTTLDNDEPINQTDYLQIKDEVDRKFVEQLISEIQHNLSDPDFNVEMLAQKFNIDRSALFRKLKKVLDKSPSVLIQELRIIKAMEMLKNGRGNVSEVAYACGYNSLSYFSQAFKAHTSKSPSEWLFELRV